jgi:hypothetical protein
MDSKFIFSLPDASRFRSIVCPGLDHFGFHLMGKLRVFSFNGLWLRDFCEGFSNPTFQTFSCLFTSGFGVVNNLSPAK